MTHVFSFKASLIVASMLALPLAQAATMSKDAYKSGKDGISAQYKTDKAACAPMSANAKDICKEEAKAKEKVARAELEYGYTGKARDGTKVMEVKAKTAYAVAKEKCDDQAGNAKDICQEEAKAKEKVARAELEYGYTGKARDGTKVLEVKAKTAYAVAKEKCDDQAGNAKDVCRKEAKAVEVKALADAKMAKRVGEARTDAAVDKRDADYKVAAEKCDALAGDAKTSCMNAAKSKFGKM